MASALVEDLLTVASSVCFAASNVTIARGARPEAEDNGAFVSLLLTTVIAGAGWALVGAMRSSTMKRLIPFFSVMLGVGVLGERLTASTVAGMALILASFAVLLASSRGSPARRDSLGAPGLNWGYAYGAVSALGYASGYLLRKLGLADAHDALLGAAVGCLVGALLFVATAAFSPRYAGAVRATFARPNGWLLAAGVLSSFGQILYFGALNVNPMSRVALVSSIEVFVTLAMAVVFLRRIETLTLPVAIAAALGVGGTVLIMAGD